MLMPTAFAPLSIVSVKKYVGRGGGGITLLGVYFDILFFFLCLSKKKWQGKKGRWIFSSLLKKKGKRKGE